VPDGIILVAGFAGGVFPFLRQGGPAVLRKIECYIQPFKLEALTRALVEHGVDGMTVTEVRGFGRQRGHAAEDSCPEEDIHFLPKLKLEIVVMEDMVDETVQLIVRLARTGAVGAGKVFVLPVEDAVRVGSGEVGRTAIE
jgi:nitrogen regulatory protein P-II 1